MSSVQLETVTKMPETNRGSFKLLNYGESGTGKTYCTVDLLNYGQKVRFLAAENNAVTGARAGLKAFKGARSEGDFAIMIPSRQKQSIKDLAKNFDKVLSTPMTTLITTADANRKSYTRFINILHGLADFVDGDTGVSHGTIDSWNNDTTLVVDGLTIICEAINQGIIGSKLGMTQPEFQAAQLQLVSFLRLLTEDLACNLVMIAHPDKDIDQITGKQTIYPGNIGKALNNKIPSMFTDVVWSFRQKDKFLWSTDHPQAVTRASSLPLRSELPQSFAPFFA